MEQSESVLGKMAFLDEVATGGSTTRADEVLQVMRKELDDCKRRLTPDQYQQLEDLVTEFFDIFYREGEQIKPLRRKATADARSVAVRRTAQSYREDGTH